MQPLVSVLMTVYNREKYIAQAIESVLVSTYQNWELIVVDDQSRDRSVEIAQSYAAKDARIKVYVNEVNLGDYPNRNRAASYARGKYLKYVDADDMIYPYGLEQLVYYMEQFPDAGYGLCSLEQDEKRIFPFQLNPQQAYHRHYFEQPLFHKAPLSSIIRKDAFEDVGGFTHVRHFGDFDMWHKLSNIYSLVLMPHGIVWYRQGDGQEAAIRKLNPLNNLLTLNCGKIHIGNISCPLSENERIIVIRSYERKIARSIFSAMIHHSITKMIELKQYSQMGWGTIIRKGLMR